jgi:hypothetical protein
MHDLRLVGVHEDGEHLLLAGPGDEQYLLEVDESLRAAVRRDRAHLGQLQIEMAGELRPREVQAQIRAGATAAEVAERTGWPLDRVRRYEGAVLAERAHIADLARAVTLRRRGADTSPPTLGSRVEQRLSARGVDLRHNVWDSWRAEDGPWMLTLRFVAGGREREARWMYDPAARTISAQDDEALWLSEDEKPPAPPQAAPHLAAVPTVTAVVSPGSGADLYDVDADGGIDPLATITMESASAVDLVGAMRQRRHGRRRLTAAEERSATVGEQAEGPSAKSGAPGDPPPVPEQEALELEPVAYDPDAHDERPAAHPFPFPERVRPSRGTAGSSDVESATPPEPAAPADSESAPPSAGRPRGFGPPPPTPSPASTAPPPGRPGPMSAGSAHGVPTQPPVHRRARRASVPSWDEIMFGGKRD